MPNKLFSPFCFRPSSPTTTTVGQPLISGNPTLTTCLYHTEFGLFGLTWSRNLLGRSLHLHLHLHLLLDNSTEDASFPAPSSPSFQLQIKPFTFWKKRGSKKLILDTSTSSKAARVYWDLSKAQFGSRPEPLFGFYIAIVIDGEMTLLVGDSPKEAYASTRATIPQKDQVMVLRREHVYGNKLYTTKADFGGKERYVSIDCRIVGDDPRLYFCVDNKRVLQIKHLKWKFRGNERVEVDGISVQISWDVRNWLFDDDDDGYALFMFRFQYEDDCFRRLNEKNGIMLWSQQTCGFGFETKKMNKGLLRSARSSSSSSLSSASSSCSSVMEWSSTEENELRDPSGFSLLVYAWKS